MQYQITHKTWYTYADLAPVCHNLVHLAPRATPHQRCAGYRLIIKPTPAFLTHRDDYFGNRTEYFSIEGAHRKLEIIAESTVDVLPLASQQSRNSPPWEECVIDGAVSIAADTAPGTIEPIRWQLTFPSPRVPHLPEIREYAAVSFKPHRAIIEAIVDLTARIHADYQFDPRATTVDTPLAEVLRLRRGVCQDFAHLATACVRAMGLAARYTSGYLRTIPPPGKPRLVGADASHAWCAAWCGPLGWIEFDPTNNCLANDSYVTIAWGRDYGDVCPIQGVFVGGGEHRMGVSVDVAPQPSPDAGD
jgi:transglutaminase-like putative cysteine protease